jgi:alkylated DNA repair dioxygenase AlkB
MLVGDALGWHARLMSIVEQLGDLISAADRHGWAHGASVLDAETVAGIAAECRSVTFEALEDTPVVRQHGMMGDAAYPPANPALWAFVEAVENAAALAGRVLRINEAKVQTYRPGGGVSPHRDHVRYAQLIVILTLEGTGAFEVVTERVGGSVLARWELQPGSIVVVDADRRPRAMHTVTASSSRMSVTLRCNTDLPVRQA